jgi:hypothetical protein
VGDSFVFFLSDDLVALGVAGLVLIEGTFVDFRLLGLPGEADVFVAVVGDVFVAVVADVFVAVVADVFVAVVADVFVAVVANVFVAVVADDAALIVSYRLESNGLNVRGKSRREEFLCQTLALRSKSRLCFSKMVPRMHSCSC